MRCKGFMVKYLADDACVRNLGFDALLKDLGFGSFGSVLPIRIWVERSLVNDDVGVKHSKTEHGWIRAWIQREGHGRVGWRSLWKPSTKHCPSKASRRDWRQLFWLLFFFSPPVINCK